MVRLFTFIFTLIIISSCIDNKQSEHYQLNKNEVIMQYKGGKISLSAITDDIINIRYKDSLTYSDRNYAPVLTDNIVFDIQETENNLTLKTSKVKVIVDLETFKIKIFDNTDHLKLSTLSPFQRDGDTARFQFYLKEKEAIYGTGSRALPLNRRGYKLQNYNKANYAYGMGAELLNYCIPHIISSEQYMLLFDNPARSYFDIGKSNHDLLSFSSLGGNMSYYFINGDDYKNMIEKYADLTGHQDLPPIWAFGNLQSRFGYRSQKEATDLLNKSLSAGYPVDAMILDIYWFGPELQDGQMGKLDWDLEKWPDPKSMITEFQSKGVKTITVSEPFFTLKSGRFKELEEKGFLAKDSSGNAMRIPYFYFGETGLLDIFNKEAQDWVWKDYLRQDQYDIDGWWVDLGEPEVHPDNIIHVNGTGNEVHGAYGHEWAKVLYEGYEKDYPNERLFHMGRAGFAGSQRYSLIPWSGDVGRTWSGLKAQLPIMLGIGMSGIGYMHGDAGGFTFVEKANPELYTRWLQFAAFTPIFRPHADEVVAPEPVTWSPEVQAKVKPSIDLRYTMLPYNYTLAWKNMITGLPMARPMFMEYNNIPDTLMTQYMWGNDLLVSPVLETGIKEQKTYLPEGEWYDFFTNQSNEGGQWINQILAENHIPVYAKGGSIIPMVGKMKNTEEYKTDTVQLNYYFAPLESSSQIYFDDGKTKNAYQKGLFHLLSIDTKATSASVNFNIELTGSGYDGALASRVCKFNMIGASLPKSVQVDGNEVSFVWVNEQIIFSFELSKNNKVSVFF